MSMFKRAVVGVVLIVAVVASLAPLGVRAQDNTDPLWHFAPQRNTGAIIAYQQDGTQQIVLESSEYERAQGWRVAPDTILALMEDEDGEVLARITPDAVQILLTEAELEDRSGPVLISVINGIAVFALEVILPGGSHIVVDVAAGTVDWLTGDVLFLGGNSVSRFAEDGTRLRYWTRADSDSEDWTLIERDLISGEELSVHTITVPRRFPPVAADTYGERWLLQESDPDTKAITYTLLHIDGTREVLGEYLTSTDEDRAAVKVLRLVEDYLVEVPVVCEADCPVTLTPLDGGNALTYTLSVYAMPFYPQRVLAGDRLLVLVDNAWWLLEPSGGAQVLGYWSPQQVFTPWDWIVSADGRWLVTVDAAREAEHFQLWNLDSETMILEEPMDVAITSIMRPGAVMIRVESRPYRIVYLDTVTEAVVDLPTDFRGYYFEVLPDRSLLYLKADSDLFVPGIYRYDPVADEFALLVPDGWPVELRQLP